MSLVKRIETGTTTYRDVFVVRVYIWSGILIGLLLGFFVGFLLK